MENIWPAPGWGTGDISDEALLLQLAAGQTDVLGSLYSRYAPLIFDIAARTLDRATAEEIVQDVFLSVWRAAPSFDPERGAVRPWLLQIAHFRVINELRRRSRRPKIDPDPDGLRVEALSDPDPDPAEAASLSEAREVVRSAYETLPPQQREAVGLAFFGGLSHAEVAEHLDLPLGTAKTRIRSGLRRLRSQLTPLMIALLVAAGSLVAVAGIRYRTEQADRRLEERAVALLAASDTADLRLGPADDLPADAHGRYHGRPGATIAVVTMSHMPATPDGHSYRVWLRHGDTWTSIGDLEPDSTGAARLIVQGDVLSDLPDEVLVCVDPGGAYPEPRGPIVLSWTVPGS
jgi:RNA polymerase sigma-70 factor (ECF subfamily)